MIFSNIMLVGFYTSFIFIFLYCYWSYSIYKTGLRRIGQRAAVKYEKEMTELNPLHVLYRAEPAQIEMSKDKKKVTVRFNIYNSNNIPIKGAIRVYDIKTKQSECLTESKKSRVESPECEGIITDEKVATCYNTITSGLSCLWL
jgi:hypothetical protein